MNKQSGLTLIEVLVASVLIVLIAAGVLALQSILGESQTETWKSYISIENANGAVSQISNELRNATISATGSYPLVTADDNEIVFYSDYDFDGVVEKIRYTLNQTTLSKGIVEPSGEPLDYDTGTESVRVISDILRNGSDPVFYYYNSDWPIDTVNNPLAGGDRIGQTSFVKIRILTNTEINQPDHDYELISDVRPRMLQEVE